MKGTGYAMVFSNGTTEYGTVHSSTYGLNTAGNADGQTIGTIITPSGSATNNQVLGLTTTGANSGVVADLSTATAATINQLREAFQLQRMLEKDALSGTRYIEIIKSHFGVTSPDARLQRPEYLGGCSSVG